MINKDYYRNPGYNIPKESSLVIIEINAEYFLFINELSIVEPDHLKLRLIWGEIVNQIFMIMTPNGDLFLKELENIPSGYNQPYIEELILSNWISNFELLVKNLALSIYNRLADTGMFKSNEFSYVLLNVIDGDIYLMEV